MWLMLKEERLRKGSKAVIPSCVVKKNPTTFPVNNNDKTGFKATMDDVCSCTYELSI